MSIKVSEFIIQAKVIEEDGQNASGLDNEEPLISNSLKKEIIDECMAKMKELLEREKSRY